MSIEEQFSIPSNDERHVPAENQNRNMLKHYEVAEITIYLQKNKNRIERQFISGEQMAAEITEKRGIKCSEENLKSLVANSPSLNDIRFSRSVGNAQIGQGEGGFKFSGERRALIHLANFCDALSQWAMAVSQELGAELPKWIIRTSLDSSGDHRINLIDPVNLGKSEAQRERNLARKRARDFNE